VRKSALGCGQPFGIGTVLQIVFANVAHYFVAGRVIGYRRGDRQNNTSDVPPGNERQVMRDGAPQVTGTDLAVDRVYAGRTAL
jgi:hypothetical protein